MKNTLRSQLENFKKDNTESSKESMLSTLDTITNSMESQDSTMLKSVEVAKKALQSNQINKNEIVQTVENVISNLSYNYNFKRTFNKFRDDSKPSLMISNLIL